MIPMDKAALAARSLSYGDVGATRPKDATWSQRPPGGRVRVNDSFWLVAHLGPVTVREPVRVVAVVDEPDRRGFAYGTLDGQRWYRRRYLRALGSAGTAECGA